MVADKDEDLVARARSGSLDAFGELVRAHQAAVRAYAARYVRDWDTAGDLAQEAFLAAHQALGSFRQDASFRTWVVAIVRRLVVDHLRQEARRSNRNQIALTLAMETWQLEHADSAAGAPAEHEREIEALSACMKALPRESARMIQAHYFRGRTAADIARGEGQRGGATRMALLRIRRALRQCVEARLTALARTT
jgi:RNA polymerase sigma-70 factor (ECF subfamily)